LLFGEDNKMSRSLLHAALALFLAASLASSPLYAQNQQAPAPAAQSQTQPQVQAPPIYQPPTPAATAPPAPARNLGLAQGPHYDAGRSWYRNPLGPYEGLRVEQPVLINTPRIDQLIQDGKLVLSLEDAISLGLENNLSIAVERYVPWLDEANLLLAKSGANGRASFDPSLTSQFNIEEQTTPVNNPFVALVPCPADQFCPPFPLTGHTVNGNFGYTQNFHSGTQFQLTFDNQYVSQPEQFSYDLLNPYYQSTLELQVTQPLLNGFGRIPNDRYIIEAKNTVKIGESQFKQQVINTVTQIATDYWELVYARENVKVEQVTVAADQQLYNNNRKQLEIGTMAPLDVITAQAQLATDQQALVQAQTTQLLDQTTLLVAITKNSLTPSLQNAEIVPTTSIFAPTEENTSLQDAVQIAFKNRPEVDQALLTLQNDDVEIKATKNALLPTVNLFGLYEQTGLGGTAQVCTANCGLFEAGKETKALPLGLGYALNTMITSTFPTYEGGVNITLPIRNRAAEAANATAQLNQRQQQVNLLNTQATIVLNVRQALIALEQDRAAVAAEESRIYNQQSYDDEVKKLQLGSSTAFTVVQKQQLLTVAQGTELRDRINLIEAELNLDQALGRTLDVHDITLGDAVKGAITHPPNIPGALDTTGSGNK
jgi:outer membrane protein